MRGAGDQKKEKRRRFICVGLVQKRNPAGVTEKFRKEKKKNKKKNKKNENQNHKNNQREKKKPSCKFLEKTQEKGL